MCDTFLTSSYIDTSGRWKARLKKDVRRKKGQRKRAPSDGRFPAFADSFLVTVTLPTLGPH